jgi:DNA-binding HxlR family transcriptional regulator
LHEKSGRLRAVWVIDGTGPSIRRDEMELSVTPPSTLYDVDRAGKELREAIGSLAHWGERWLTVADGHEDHEAM